MTDIRQCLSLCQSTRSLCLSVCPVCPEISSIGLPLKEMKTLAIASGLAALLPTALACGSDSSCYGPTNTVEHVRHVKRIQPGVPNAAYGPKAPLEWGQLNFLHTVCMPILLLS